MTENRAEINFAGGARSAEQNISILERVASLAIREGYDSEVAASAFDNIANEAEKAAKRLREETS